MASIEGLRASLTAVVRDVLDVAGRPRRAWIGNGRAYIEVRGATGPRRETLRRRLEARLRRLPEVNWAEVNTVTGRVVVAFVGDPGDLGHVLDVIESVEDATGTGRDSLGPDRPEHPGDAAPLHRQTIALAADLLGLGASVLGRLARIPALPPYVGAATSIIDSVPRLRGELVNRLGPAGELGLATVNAAAQAVSQGSLGLLVDAGHRAGRLGELQARSRAWHRREADVATAVPAEPAHSDPRPVRTPAGPVERYANRAPLASAAAFLGGFALTGNPLRAADLLVAGVPKAARLGREGFAEQLGRALSNRGCLVMDDTVLRRLDRVDTVVLDSALLTTSAPALGRVVALDELPKAAIRGQANARFTPSVVTEAARSDGWWLGPLDRYAGSVPAEKRAAVAELEHEGIAVLALARRDRLVGAVSVVERLDELADALVRAARDAGLRVVVAGDPTVAARLDADETVPGADELTASVRRLQGDHRGVALVAGGPAAALRAADCGIGVPTELGDHLAGHLVTVPGLGQSAVILGACGPAHRTSVVSARLALGGSLLGGAMAMMAPPFLAARRAVLGVNSAAIAALANGSWAGFESGNRPQPVAAAPVDWHALGASEALLRLGSRQGGLTEAEAGRRRRATPEALGDTDGRPSLAHALVDELANPFTPLLAAGALLSSATGSIADGALIGGVTAMNALIGTGQRMRTDRALRRLVEASGVRVDVIRAGRRQPVTAEELVPGDVVSLTAGEVVPADCRVLETQGVEVDESALTGESLPVTKTAEPCPGVALSDQRCMLFADTTIAAGGVTAVAVAVGRATVAARALAGAPASPPSGVEARLSRITRSVVPLTLAAGGVTAALGMVRAVPIRAAVQSGLALTLAAVPEGLPLLATVAQSASARRLSAQNALVRNPRTIEALGRIDLLCFDKTGTLTAGRLTVRRVSDGRTDQPLEELDERHCRTLAAGLRATPRGNGQRLPHATDEAVVQAAERAQVQRSRDAPGWEAVAELPFDSARGLHAVAGASTAGNWLSVKGAPEVVLPRCTGWSGPDGDVELDQRLRSELDAAAEHLARQRFRVLAVAEGGDRAPGGELTDEAVAGLRLLGYLAIADPIRQAAADAVNDLRAAGVDVAMITGDHASTAEAIAAELGMLDDHRVLTGGDLDELDDDELAAALRIASVFARVTPAHKVRIVEGFQRAGRVVAMTGDGANDAAAIRLANVGIAIGRRGGPAAREAADVVVTDERLETIIQAIVEGRAMWVSVRDALAILLGGNLGESAFTLAATALTGRAPLGTRQLLLVNLLTDLLPAMTIALRPPTWTSTQELLDEGPESSLGASLERAIALRAVTTTLGATGGWLVARATGRARRARTVGLVALVGTQLAQTAIAGRRSPLVLVASAASGAALAGIVQTPVVSHFFGCTPLGPVGWATATGAAGAATAGSIVAPRLVGRLVSLLPTRVTATDAGEPGANADLPTSRPHVGAAAG